MRVQLRLVLVINYVPNTRVTETLASLASVDSDILLPRAQKVGYGAVPVGFGGYPMAYGAALFSSFQTQKRNAQEIEDTTWVSVDAADSRLVDHMRMLLARQEQQKKIALGTFVSGDEDSPVQWQTELLQNRVEDLETALAEKNTELNPLHEERKDLRELMGALRRLAEYEGKLMDVLHQGKLMGALRCLAEYEGDRSSSKRPRESSREPSRSWRDRSNSRERFRGRQGSRLPKVTYAGGLSSEGEGSSGSRGRDMSGGRLIVNL
jgi:predicted component of type VI protein secretion system